MAQPPQVGAGSPIYRCFAFRRSCGGYGGGLGLRREYHARVPADVFLHRPLLPLPHRTGSIWDPILNKRNGTPLPGQLPSWGTVERRATKDRGAPLPKLRPQPPFGIGQGGPNRFH